jgi:LysM repeat protein
MCRRSAAALALALLLPLPGLAAEVVVKPGDTLSELAERYGTTVDRLMQLNNLRSPDDVWAGSRLQVPGAGGGSRSGTGNYTVKAGETLSEIAVRYGTTVDRLMQLNSLRNPEDLWAGSRIQVPGAGSSSSTAARSSGQANYTVKSGETLSELAERYNTSVQRLVQINNLNSPDDLWAGSRIQVPAPPKPPSQPAVNKNASKHQVQPGDSLSLIAQRYGVSMQSLIAINSLSDPNRLEVGRTLTLRGSSAPKAAAKPATAAKPTPKPAAKPVVQATAKPAAQPAAKPATQPAAQPVATAAAAVQNTSPEPTAKREPELKPEAKPEPKPEPTVQAATSTPVAQQASKPEPEPEPKPEPKPQPKSETKVATAKTSSKSTSKAAAASKPTSTASASTAGKGSAPDWRSYGPLQVDWANWQSMGGSYVAPSLNSDGQPLYLAINCGAKRLNATGQSGAWKTWDAPQSEFEHKLIRDLCSSKGS